MTLREDIQAILQDADADFCGDEDTKRIVEEGIALIRLLLDKNSDYGRGISDVPSLVPQIAPGEAILVRMSDKVGRIQTLSQQPPRVAGESLRESIADLAGYGILYLAFAGK